MSVLKQIISLFLVFALSANCISPLAVSAEETGSDITVSQETQSSPETDTANNGMLPVSTDTPETDPAPSDSTTLPVIPDNAEPSGSMDPDTTAGSNEFQEPDITDDSQNTEMSEGTQDTEVSEDIQDPDVSDSQQDITEETPPLLNSGEPTFTFSNGKLTGCDPGSATEIVIPEQINSVTVSVISDQTFQNLTTITSVVIPSTVKTIADSAFSGCTALETVSIPQSVTFIGSQAFSGCSSLKELSLTGVQTISYESFSGCTALSSLSLPNTLTAIGVRAFADCTSLTNVTIPGSVVNVGANAFVSCSGLTTVIVEEGVRLLDACCFWNCTSLTDITFPPTLSMLGEFIFAADTDASVPLNSADLGHTQITTIPNGAFNHCTSLKTVTLPDTVTALGSEAFRECTSLTSVNIPDSVQSIGNSAFFNCHSLQQIHLPDGIQILDEWTFFHCCSLTELTIPGSVHTIGNYALRFCQGLTNIEIPASVTTIGTEAFQDCIGLTSIVIPDSVTDLGARAFYICSGLRSAVIGEGITEIKEYTFSHCAELEQLTIGSNVRTIGSNAFSYCYNKLSEINLPHGVEIIGDYAFDHCNQLSVITIPETVTQLGSNAFDSNIIQEAWVLNRNMTFGTSVFPRAPVEFTIHGYPGSTAEAYASANGHLFKSMGSRTLSVRLMLSEEEELTSGFTITWYDEEDTVVCETPQFAEADPDRTYRFEIDFTDEVAVRFVLPEGQTITPDSGDETILTLTPIPTLIFSGKAADQNGQGISGASVTVRILGTTVDQTAETDASGGFSLVLPALDAALTIRRDGYYSVRSNHFLSAVQAETYNAGIITMSETISDRIALEVSLIPAAEDPGSAIEIPLSQPQSLSFDVTGGSGNSITGYELQGSSLIFLPGDVSAGEAITIRASDPSGEYLASDAVTVTLDSNKIGSASLSLTQKGMLQLGGVTNCEATATLFNSQGKSIWVTPAGAGITSAPLDAGAYTLVLLENTSLLRSIDSLAYLDSLGLTAGADYLKLSVSIQNGVLCKLDACSIPELNENRLTHTLEHAVSVTKPAGYAPGELFMLRLSYRLDPAKGVSAQSLQAVLPQGVEPADGRTALVNNAAATYSYDASSRIITLNVSGLEECEAYLYCMAGAAAGDYSINGALALSNGILQPIGTAFARVHTATLTVPENPASAIITASGKTAPYASVTVYDNGIAVATVTANAVGSWSTSIDLTKNQYILVYHQIYARISSSYFGSPLTTERKLVTYDQQSVELSKITMYNTDDFGESITVFDFTSHSTTVPHYRFNPTLPTFRFEVEFRGNSPLAEAFVAVEDDLGTMTYIPLTKSASGVWTATHDFERPPVAVGASFTKEQMRATPMDEEFYNAVKEEAQQLTSEISAIYDAAFAEHFENTFDPETMMGTLSCTDPETAEVYTVAQYRMEANHLAEGTTAASLEENGYIAISEDATMWMYMDHSSSTSITLANLDQMLSVTLVVVFDGSTASAADLGESLYYWWIEDVYDFKNNLAPFLDAIPGPIGLAFKGANLVANAADLWNQLKCFEMQIDGNYQVLLDYLDHLEKLMEMKCEDGSYVLNYGDLDYARAQLIDLIGEVGQYRQMCHDLKMKLTGLNAFSFLGSLTLALLPNDPKMDKLNLNGYDIMSAYLGFNSNQITGPLTKMNLDAMKEAVGSGFEDVYGDLTGLQDWLLPKLDMNNCKRQDPDKPPVKPVEVWWDPSGYVFEAVPSNRLSGVTAEIYYEGTDGSDVRWNAADYDQISPQITDASGSYRWDVIPGNWKVIFTKDGYLTADTSQVEQAVDGWLPVPPPQLNIHVGMISTNAPVVVQTAAYSDRTEVKFSQYMNIESVQDAVSLLHDGNSVSVNVQPLDAEYDLSGEHQYATRFALIPTDGSFTGSVILGVSTDAENYAGTALENTFISSAMDPVERPTGLNGPDAVSIGTGKEVTIALTLQPCVAGKMLQVETATPSLVSVLTDEVVTDENGRAVISVQGIMPGDGSITVTEPESGLHKTIAVNTMDPAEDSTVQSVVATLEDGTVITTGMALPAGTRVFLTSLSENAVIRYTLNNTCPCKDTALTYTGPIVLTEDVSYLRAAACLNGVYSATIKIALTVTGTSLRGDLNNDGVVNDGDVEYLLWHTLFPEFNPISGDADFDGNGTVNDADVEYLLWHTLFPEFNPL